MRSLRRLVLLRSSGSSGCDLGVVPIRLVHANVPLGSLGLFGLSLFVRVRPEGRCVLSGSCGSSRCALGVTWFVLVRLLRSGVPLGSLGSFLDCSGATQGSL